MDHNVGDLIFCVNDENVSDTNHSTNNFIIAEIIDIDRDEANTDIFTVRYIDDPSHTQQITPNMIIRTVPIKEVWFVFT